METTEEKLGRFLDHIRAFDDTIYRDENDVNEWRRKMVAECGKFSAENGINIMTPFDLFMFYIRSV